MNKWFHDFIASDEPTGVVIVPEGKEQEYYEYLADRYKDVFETTDKHLGITDSDEYACRMNVVKDFRDEM